MYDYFEVEECNSARLYVKDMFVWHKGFLSWLNNPFVLISNEVWKISEDGLN